MKAAYRLPGEDGNVGSNAIRMFEMVQRAQVSAAAKSMAEMAARAAIGSAELAALFRQRQELIRERNRLYKLWSEGDPADRTSENREKWGGLFLESVGRLAGVGTKLESHPYYRKLVEPEPLSLQEVQTHLRADEVLVVFIDTAERKPLPEESFIWLVTKSELRWVRSELGTEALKRDVEALRCGLDNGLWDDSVKREKCLALLDVKSNGDEPGANTLPFDVKRAHALYQALFGQVEDLIVGKHLLIVPTGALQTEARTTERPG